MQPSHFHGGGPPVSCKDDRDLLGPIVVADFNRHILLGLGAGQHGPQLPSAKRLHRDQRHVDF